MGAHAACGELKVPVETVAIIPARGGSKGVPGKNLRAVNGIPLVGRTVRAAVDAVLVDSVYVSTDDEHIADVARAYGADIITRPPELSGDDATSESALLHALDVLKAKGENPRFTVFLQCTSPFTTADHIDAVVTALRTSSASAAFAATPDHSFLWRVGSDGFAEGVNHDEKVQRKRRQDLEAQYREAGSIYAMRTTDFLRAGRRFCGPSVLVPINAPPIEIDSEDDLQVCSALASASARTEFQLPRSIRALVMDFDGVLTDDRVLVSDSGGESVLCSRSDGLGIGLLRQIGIKMLILSKEKNSVVAARAAKLQVPAHHGIDDKLPVLMEWMQSENVARSETIYLGNDVNDLPCLKWVEWPIAPADAHPEVKRVARYVTTAKGGRGAVREVADSLVRARA